MFVSCQHMCSIFHKWGLKWKDMTSSIYFSLKKTEFFYNISKAMKIKKKMETKIFMNFRTLYFSVNLERQKIFTRRKLMLKFFGNFFYHKNDEYNILVYI